MPRIISTDVNIEEKNVNIDNVNSRNVNSINVNCTDKSRQDKGLIKDKRGGTIIWRGIVMCVELLRGVLSSLKYVLTVSVSIKWVETA